MRRGGDERCPEQRVHMIIHRTSRVMSVQRRLRRSRQGPPENPCASAGRPSSAARPLHKLNVDTGFETKCGDGRRQSSTGLNVSWLVRTNGMNCSGNSPSLPAHHPLPVRLSAEYFPSCIIALVSSCLCMGKPQSHAIGGGRITRCFDATRLSDKSPAGPALFREIDSYATICRIISLHCRNKNVGITRLRRPADERAHGLRGNSYGM